MNLVACPRCGAQFDVAAFAPGTKFVCGACKNMLQVPAAAPAAPPAPVVAPVVAARPAAKAAEPPAPLAKKPAVDRRRAGDAAKGQAAGPGRAERLRAQRTAAGEEGEKKKSPMPLVLAGVGVLVLAGVGAAFALKGGGDGAAADSGGPTGVGAALSGKGGEGSKSETAKPKEKTWDDLTPTERLALAEAKKKEGLASAASVKEVHAWLEGKGLAGDAKAYLSDARARFPGDPWVMEKLGLVDRSIDIRKAATDDEVLFAVSAEDPELKAVTDLHDRIKKDKTAGWLSKEESERFDRSVAILREQVGKMNDPVYQRTQQEFQNLKSDPAFAGMQFSFESFRPYVIFAELPGAEKKEVADRIVASTGKVMTFLYGRWLRFMKEDLKLEPTKLEDLKDERLKIFVFNSRESFDGWHTRNQMRVPQFAGAYYEHGRNRMIMMHLDQWDAHVTMHEGTHQLIHFYARHFCEKNDHAEAEKKGDPKEKVEYEDRRLNSAFFWFQEGIAEYFGGAVKDRENEGEWKIGAMHRDHLGFFGAMRGMGKTWPLADFVDASQGQILARAGVRSGGTMTQELHGLMYAQGWLLVHYFLHGEGGKWKEPFLRLMRNELQGVTGKVYLLDAFGLPRRTDDPKVQAWMKEVEAGYLKYYEQLVKEMALGGR